MNSEISFFRETLVETSNAGDRDKSATKQSSLHCSEYRAKALGLKAKLGISLLEVSDEKLLEQICRENKEALGILFRRHARAVRHVAYRILRNEAEAEDLAQEVFLFVYRKAALFDPSRGGARSWIFQAAYHRAIDRRRYLDSRHFYTNSEPEEAAICLSDPKGRSSFYEDTLEGTLGEEKLRRMWEALSEDQRQVLELYFFNGDTFEEAAARIGQTVGNIRNHYYRGLEKLRKQFFASPRKAK